MEEEEIKTYVLAHKLQETRLYNMMIGICESAKSRMKPRSLN